MIGFCGPGLSGPGVGGFAVFSLISSFFIGSISQIHCRKAHEAEGSSSRRWFDTKLTCPVARGTGLRSPGPYPDFYVFPSGSYFVLNFVSNRLPIPLGFGRILLPTFHH